MDCPVKYSSTIQLTAICPTRVVAVGVSNLADATHVLGK